jgi:anti-anti-sigma factor
MTMFEDAEVGANPEPVLPQRQNGASTRGARPTTARSSPRSNSPRTEPLILRIVGEIDIANAGALTLRLGDVRTPTRHVVVDLTAVTFLDTCALNALGHGERELGERGISMRVVASRRGHVSRLFDLAGLSGTIELLGDDAESTAPDQAGETEADS